MASFDVRFAAPPQVVFDYLADPRNRPEWQSSLRSVLMLDEGPPRTGMRWVDHTAVGVRPVMEIVGLQPPGDEPGFWAESGEWHGIKATLALTFLPVADDPAATDLRVDVDLPAGALWLLPARALLRRLAPAAVRGDLRTAAEIIEGR